MGKTQKVTFSLSREDLDKIDYLVEHDYYSSRTEAIRNCVRDFIYQRVTEHHELAKASS